VKENAAENILLRSALGKNLFKSFFAGVEAETANIKLATATAAAAAATAAAAAAVATTVSAAVTTSSVITTTVASTSGIATRRWTAGFARGAAGTMPASF
jgi:hypothetical protein